MSFADDEEQWTIVQRPRRKRQRLGVEHAVDRTSSSTTRGTDRISTKCTTTRSNNADTKRRRKDEPVVYKPCEDDVKWITLQLLQQMRAGADCTTPTVNSSMTRTSDPLPSTTPGDTSSDVSWYKVSHNKHVKIARQLGDVAQVMILACTPSDCRAAKNLRARFKRADRALAAGVGGLF